jgi:hypothetical protein
MALGSKPIDDARAPLSSAFSPAVIVFDKVASSKEIATTVGSGRCVGVDVGEEVGVSTRAKGPLLGAGEGTGTVEHEGSDAISSPLRGTVDLHTGAESILAEVSPSAHIDKELKLKSWLPAGSRHTQKSGR